MKIERIFLDMDGVLADFVRGAGRAHLRNMGEILEAQVPGEYDIVRTFGYKHDDDFWGPINAQGVHFWEMLGFYPWADALLKSCQNIAPVTIATSPSRLGDSAAGKVRWLQNWLGETFRDYMLGSEKHLMARPGRVLIDDYDRNCEAWEAHGGTAIVFPRPWNSGHKNAGWAFLCVIRRLKELQANVQGGVYAHK